MMDDRLGKFSSRDCQSLFLSHELNAFLTWHGQLNVQGIGQGMNVWLFVQICATLFQLVGTESGSQELVLQGDST